MSEQSRATPASGSRPSVGFMLSQLGFSTSRRFGQIVGTLGLEPRHFALLRAVRQSDGQSQQAIADQLRIPASTMVSLIDQLEGRAMLERRPHPTDRRTRLLHLTEQGAEVLAEAIRLGDQWEATICSGLSAADREQLISLLRRVANNIGVAERELPDHGTGQRPDALPADGPI
jgi:DNA-binding MarR family transcriptional regulator